MQMLIDAVLIYGAMGISAAIVIYYEFKRKEKQMFIVEDHTTNKVYIVEDKYELEERLMKEFDLSHEGVEDAIKSLCRKLGYEYTGGEEAFLNISVKF